MEKNEKDWSLYSNATAIKYIDNMIHVHFLLSNYS